jgi:hypothetical protein
LGVTDTGFVRVYWIQLAQYSGSAVSFVVAMIRPPPSIRNYFAVVVVVVVVVVIIIIIIIIIIIYQPV